MISIHALLAESDLRVLDGSKSSIISIHALLAESDTWQRGSRITYVISIHALLAESDRFFYLWCILCLYISIHALLAESDNSSVNTADQEARFLSTLSLRRATACLSACVVGASISIHALLAESDCYSLRYSASRWHFYPRSPCGERLIT